MRFLVDECVGPAVAEWLRAQSHPVFSVYEEAPGSDDEFVIQKAFSEGWILITSDKDFGEKVYRDGHPHSGVIFLRLADDRTAVKIATLRHLLENYENQLTGQFVVVTESRVRFARP